MHGIANKHTFEWYFDFNLKNFLIQNQISLATASTHQPQSQFSDSPGLQLLQDDIIQEELLQRQRQEAVKRVRLAKLERNPWIAFQDIVGNANTWPTFIRQAFWSGKNFDDRQRMIVVNFSHLNGASLNDLMSVLSFTIGRHLDRNSRWYQVQARYNYLNSDRENCRRAFSYHVQSKQILNLLFEPVDSYGRPRKYPYRDHDEKDRELMKRRS